MWCLHWCQQNPMSKKSCVTPCFRCLYLMNKKVPLMMYLASHDSNAGTNGITWIKKSCFTSLWSLWPNGCSDAIDNTIGITKMSRHWLYMFRYIDMSSHCLYTSRHCLDMETYLDINACMFLILFDTIYMTQWSNFLTNRINFILEHKLLPFLQHRLLQVYGKMFTLITDGIVMEIFIQIYYFNIALFDTIVFQQCCTKMVSMHVI